MVKQKCKQCGSGRKLTSCITNGGARVWLCVECLDDMKYKKENRR